MPTTLLLAGGSSRRMGRDKRFLRLSGVPLVRRAWDVAAPLGQVWVLVGDEDRKRVRGALPRGARLVVDQRPGAGPMANLAPVLGAVSGPWALVLGIDLPLVSTALLKGLVEGAAAGADAVVPVAQGRAQVAAAVYAPRIAARMQAAVARGEASLARWLGPPPPDAQAGSPAAAEGGDPVAPLEVTPGTRSVSARDRGGVEDAPDPTVQWLCAAEWRRWTRFPDPFAGVNTPGEWREVKAQLEEEVGT